MAYKDLETRRRADGKRRKLKRRLHICTRCNEPAVTTLCKRHQEYFKLRSRRRRVLRLKMGKCEKCGNKAEPNKPLCTQCNERMRIKNRVKNAARYKRCKEEHRCPRCTYPLDPEIDAGHICCINCREKLVRGQF